MTERRWTVSSTWMMTYQPDFLYTANFFGEHVGFIDLEMNPHEYNGEVRWAITFTYLRHDAEKFGELLQEFDRITEAEASKIQVAVKTEDDNEGTDYTDLPF